MKRISVILLLFIPAMLQLESCNNPPFACFQTQPDEDNIHVNQPVTFTGFCSTNADGYFWEFYDDEDSSYFGYSTTQTFYDTGYVEVYLLVTGGRKTNATRREIYVRP